MMKPNLNYSPQNEELIFQQHGARLIASDDIPQLR